MQGYKFNFTYYEFQLSGMADKAFNILKDGGCQCCKVSGSASSSAARNFLTKYLRRKFSYIL
jgi:hypothetical protein